MKQAILKISSGVKKIKPKLKNLMIRSFIFLIFFISHFAYSQNIIGVYSSVEPKCKLNLKIAHDNGFIFSIGKIKKYKGTVKISKEDTVTYLDFNDGIAAMYSNDTISIQNSGNSMNQYTHFKECDEMYIHLVKKSYFESLYSLLSYEKKLSGFIVSSTLSDIENMISEVPIQKDNIDQYNNLAYYLAQTKNGNQFAITILNEIIKKCPHRTVAYLNLADSYWIAGEKVKASINYQEYLSLMKSQKKDLKKVPKYVGERIE
ncbi:tetratricopeptide repeat protein [Chryseobacterium rhizosphaerae]|uniref:Tetratricopeptide repeat protein n=1 Tax=Chryseobacterium rhizosphaerae TaxID=395937 RepID=A0ABX9IKU3_9FLAO|nr:hypothetical protein [Chryseobacterium rhizosphaerae]REC75681.1 hypothetical protein DRF57_09935 [Chryseobacterium rhizosphaerae]